METRKHANKRQTIPASGLLGVRQFSDHREAATRLDKLKEHSERLWNDALSGKLEPEITAPARLLQDEILENRRKSPLVFDGIYKRLQRDYRNARKAPGFSHGEYAKRYRCIMASMS